LKLETSHRDKARARLLESAQVKSQVAETCLDAIVAAASLIADALHAGGKVLLCGNGGSAADCQHMAAEFLGLLTGLPAIALTTDTSFLTAFSNDFSFDGVFDRQVQALGRAGDVLIGISTSGNSANVLRAVEAARGANMQTIALTGMGGRLAEKANLVIAVPSGNTQYVQESHLAIEHILCELVEAHIFGEGQKEEVLRG